MSVPFSNTHLRVPQGFGAILEGLAREVLRDQPEDIPTYAAQYFRALLKQRDDSGMEPAEWALKLQDRFYYNHSVKAAGTLNQPTVSPEREPSTEVAISKEQSYESHTEDESSNSAEGSNHSSIQPNASDEVDSPEKTEEEDEKEEGKHDIADKFIPLTEKELSEEESVNKLPATDLLPDELSGTEEEENPTITTFDEVDIGANEKDSSSVPDQDQDITQTELQPTDLLSFRGISHVDVCAQELETDEGGDKQETAGIDEKTADSEDEEKTEADEPVEVFPYSGPSNVDVCASELGGAEATMEEAIAEDNTHVVEEENSNPQPEETAVQSSLSQSEVPQGNDQEAEDEAEKTNVEEGSETGASSGEIHESLAHIEGGLGGNNAIPKEDDLVEISFEDVPEAQQINKAGPEEEVSAEVLQTKMLEMQEEDESKEVTVVATNDESEVMGAEKEVNSEGEEMEGQHEAYDIMKDKVDTNDSNVSDSDDDHDDYEKGEGVKNISSSNQPTTEADEENPDDETDHKNEDDKKISEGEFHQNEEETKPNDPDFKENETTDLDGGDKEDKYKEGSSEVEDQEMNDGGAGNQPSLEHQSDIPTTAMETESETLVTSADLPEENEESRGTLLLPGDTVAEKEVTSKEGASEAVELVEGGTIDSEIQEGSDAMCEEGSNIPSAARLAADHRAEERSSEKDATEPEGNSGDKQEECSRPQEEEDIMDIPLDDPEANRAAAKIQAGFRGHMTRKKMKPEDKAEGEEVSSTGDVLNGSQGDTETGGSGAVERDDTSVPEQ